MQPRKLTLLRARMNGEEFIGSKIFINRGMDKGVNRIGPIHPFEDAPDLYMHISRPAEGFNALPVILYLHGGGWISGTPEGREGLASKWAGSGFAVINLAYGYAPEYPHPKLLNNVFRALMFIAEKGGEFGFDPHRVILAGDSAGAHLCALAAAAFSNPALRRHYAKGMEADAIKIRATVLNCGIYDMDSALDSGFKNMDVYVAMYGGGTLEEVRASEEYRYMSPINFVTSAFPPSFIVTALHDPLRHGGYRMVEKLQKEGVYCEHYEGKDWMAVHAFALALPMAITRIFIDKSIEFMNKQVAK